MGTDLFFKAWLGGGKNRSVSCPIIPLLYWRTKSVPAWGPGRAFSAAWVKVEEQKASSWSLEICDPSWMPFDPNLREISETQGTPGEEAGLRPSLSFINQECRNVTARGEL